MIGSRLEITSEDGLIQKLVKKGRKIHTALAARGFFSTSFDKSTRVCLTLLGHMLQQTRGLNRDLLCVVFFLLPVPYMTPHGTGARLIP